MAVPPRRKGGPLGPPFHAVRSRCPATQVVCVTSTFCCAFAYATEPSDRTFAATAALTGATMFALISDIAARSGSGSPASSSRSSRESCLYSCGVFSLMSILLSSLDGSGGLGDVRGLLCVGVRDRVVTQDIQ